MKSLILGCALWFLFMESTYAQFSLPSMDVKVAGGVSVIPMPDVDFEGVVYLAQLNIHINEYLAIGPFVSRGISMQFLGANEDFDADQLIYGINARVSTDRSSKIRPYLNLNYYKSEFVIDYGDFRTAGETPGIGMGLGLLVKINDRLYINALDIAIKKPSKELFLLPGADFVLQAHAGVSYNFGRKR